MEVVNVSELRDFTVHTDPDPGEPIIYRSGSMRAKKTDPTRYGSATLSNQCVLLVPVVIVHIVSAPNQNLTQIILIQILQKSMCPFRSKSGSEPTTLFSSNPDLTN